ncbi:MAG TPA: ABC transporter ATP-binding protein [Planctomycetota bacterium]
MSVIRAESIVKTYRLGDVDVEVLKGVDLEVRAGEYVALMGPSGSGKSTLMNILGCLDVPSGGKYFIEDREVSTLSEDQLADVRGQRIGFVFQTFNLLSRTSALENVELPLHYQGRPARQAALAALDSVGLAQRSHHRPNQLSGGERQRVAIARAVVTNPALILADEPTGNLDSKTGVEILDIFDGLHRNGATLLLVTHDHGVARRAQRVIHMRDGRVERLEEVGKA